MMNYLRALPHYSVDIGGLKLFIPQSMKTAMAKRFYDKEIHLMNKSVEQDAEGGVKTKGYSVKKSFKGNVNFSNCEKIQEEYGLSYKVDIIITTDGRVNPSNIGEIIVGSTKLGENQYIKLKINDIIKYGEFLYTLKGFYINDSHIRILGQIWQTSV